MSIEKISQAKECKCIGRQLKEILIIEFPYVVCDFTMTVNIVN